MILFKEKHHLHDCYTEIYIKFLYRFVINLILHLFMLGDVDIIINLAQTVV